MLRSLVGSEMCIRDSARCVWRLIGLWFRHFDGFSDSGECGREYAPASGNWSDAAIYQLWWQLIGNLASWDWAGGKYPHAHG